MNIQHISNPLYKLKAFIKQESLSWSKLELLFTACVLTIIFVCTLFTKNSLAAVISAVFGLIYVVSAGKGKIYCYIAGIIGTLCGAYVTFEVALYGNFALHLFYYFPMEVLGIFMWKKHLNKKTNEIYRTSLSKIGSLCMYLFLIIGTYLTYILFLRIHDASPLADAAITILSITAMLLAVKRCIEQWVVWTISNILSILMWFQVFMQGERIFTIFVVRIIYFILGIYFFIIWLNSFKTVKEPTND